MRKHLIYILSIIALAFAIVSCGGSTQELDDKPAQIDSNAMTQNQLVFDSYTPVLPFPNDLLWKDTGGIVDLTSKAGNDPAKLALYTAIKALNIKGLSPITPIAIPLANDIELDSTTFEDNIGLFDLTGFIGYTLNTQLTNYLTNINPSSQACNAFALDQDNETLAFGCFAEILGYYAQNDMATLQTLIQTADDNGYLFFDDIEIKQNDNIINIYPLKPLNAGHKYVVVVLGGLKDINGKDVLESPVYKAIRDNYKDCSKISDSDLQALCTAYSPLWDLVSAVALTSVDNILEIFTFTTADKTLSLADFGVINATLDNASLISLYDNLITGYYYDNLTDNNANEFLQVDALSDIPLICDNLSRSYDTLPAVTDGATYFKSLNLYNLSKIQQVLVTYDFPDNQTNYPLVCSELFNDNSTLYTKVYFTRANEDVLTTNVLFYEHGLGKSKEDIEYIKDDFANYQIWAMDLPWHGERVLPVDLPDTSCDETQSGSCYLTDNPIYDRLNIYQSLLDMHVFTKFIKAVYFNNGVDINLYFAGQSMGSITGAMLMNMDNITTSLALLSIGLSGNNYINKAVLNVGGGNYAALLNEATNSLITDLLSGLNLTKHSLEYYVTLGVFQLLLDPVDPEYFANNPAINSKILLQSANHDTIVPYVTNKVLAYAYNFTDFNTITDSTSDSDAIIATPAAGWYMFGEGDNWVNHGFFIHTLINLYPEAINYLDQTYVDKMQELARKQAVNFSQ